MRIALIAVDAESAVYLKIDKPKPVVLFEVARGIITGKTPDVGEARHVSGQEMSDRAAEVNARGPAALAMLHFRRGD